MLPIIGNGAFTGCGLQHIYLHDGLKSIGNYAFAISALKEINIPNSVAYIGDNCFQGCIYNHRTTKTNQKYPSVNL